MLFSSIRLSWLVPTRPMPKLSLTLGGSGGTLEKAEPFPSFTFNRTRLLLLLESQVPPQANPAEAIAFLTETFSSMSLSVTPDTRIPLKQL